MTSKALSNLAKTGSLKSEAPNRAEFDRYLVFQCTRILGGLFSKRKICGSLRPGSDFMFHLGG